MNAEEINVLTVTLVNAWDRSRNMSEAIIPEGREDIVPLAAFCVVPLQFDGLRTVIFHSVCMQRINYSWKHFCSNLFTS